MPLSFEQVKEARKHRHERTAGCFHCPLCEWYATYREAIPDRVRAAQLRRDKHVILRHNMRLDLR